MQVPRSPVGPRKGGGVVINKIINEGKDVPRHKIDAGDNLHCPIYKLLVKVVTLNVSLNCPVKPRKVPDKVCHALTSLNLNQHPQI